MQRADLTNGVMIAIDHMVFQYREMKDGYCMIKEIAFIQSNAIRMIPELSQKECLATVSEESLQLFTQFGYSTITMLSEEIPFSKIKLSDVKL